MAKFSVRQSPIGFGRQRRRLIMSKEYIEREKALEKVIEVKHYDPELSGVVLHRYIKEIDLISPPPM